MGNGRAGNGGSTTPNPSSQQLWRRSADWALSYEKLPIPDTDRMTLFVYHADPGTQSAEKLALLSSLIAADQTPTTKHARP
ncbi:hypothetical protein ACFPJ1_01580 [Kribbella qitaiheensis]|uniref:hypothetical protein n=1 Tax=Kribbella qitaiheensis TaxID=1544730 RepID=UPI00361C8809